MKTQFTASLIFVIFNGGNGCLLIEFKDLFQPILSFLAVEKKFICEFSSLSQKS
jgi:hypothetical protein